MSTLILQQKWGSFSFVQKVVSAVTMIQLWMNRHHQRKQLAGLEFEQMLDMGISFSQQKLESRKPFWK